MAQDVRKTIQKVCSTLTGGACESALEPEYEYWLKLHLIPGFGSSTLAKLPQEVALCLFELPASSLEKVGFNPKQIKAIQFPDKHAINLVTNWLAVSSDHKLLTPQNPLYPILLKETGSYPLVLFVMGNSKILNDTQIAMVGSRSPSLAGKRNAQRFARQLTENGWCVTSGLAIGIDALCHGAALDANGLTIAVTGCGLDVVYPKRNRLLVERILLQNGAIVSEYLPGTQPKAQHFPRRNRIISGMSRGTLVVEAATKSGSLITARYALEQGREVFAIPGNIDNPLSEGGHYLIKQGAKLVQGISDIHEEFQNLNFEEQSNPQKNLQKSGQQHLASDKLLDSVDFEVTALDAVLERSNLPINELMAKLLEYELRGLVAAVPGGYVKLGGK